MRAARPRGVFSIFDDQKVDVAVGTHLAAYGGPEENDLLGLGRLDDALYDVVERLTVERSALHGRFVTP